LNKILVILIISVSSLIADEWQVDKMGQRSVVFHSSTTLLDFKGTTDNIDGYIYWRGDSLFPVQSEFYFEVSPATFSTGLGKRDSDMREDVLETEKYAISSFKGKITKSTKVKDRIEIQATGIFLLHGKTKELKIIASLKRNKNRLFVECNFSVFLKDYDIDAPTLMAFVKVAQEIKINTSFEMIKVK
jgi:polyisoprenoid-binding protein YceI